MEQTRFSVVIATYNRHKDLWRLIASIKKMSYEGSVEVIVIDQSEHYEEQKNEMEATAGVKYIHINERGLSRARNVGIKEAVGEYIVLADDDASLGSDFLSNVNHFFCSHKDYGGLCGIIKNIEDAQPFSRYMDYKNEDITLSNFDKGMSSAMVLKRQALLDIGLFDERFGLGALFGASEESDLLLRMLWKKYKIRYLPAAVIFHPKFDQNKIKPDELFKKAFHYGTGRGALLRKFFPEHKGWALKNMMLAIFKPAAGILFSIVKMDKNGCIRYLASIAGRVHGFREYGKQTKGNRL